MKGLIFTYTLTYGGALVSLFNPFYGLLVYFAFSIIRPESMWYWSVPQGNYSRIVAIALLIGWAGRGFGDWRFGKGGAIVYCLIGFWLWAVASTLFAAIRTDVGFNFVENQAKILLPFLVGATVINSVTQLKQLAWTLALSQSYVALEMNMSYYQGFNRMEYLGFGGMDNNCVAIAMVTGAGLAFFLGLDAPKLWQKLLAWGGAALMAHSIMFAFSRGGMLALIITGIVSFALIPKKPRDYAVFVLAVLLALRMAGPEVVARFTTVFVDKEERDFSAQSRADMWVDCWDLMTKHPLFGIGPDHWAGIYSFQYGWQDKEAHSLWVTIGAELGFVGLGLLLAFYGFAVLRLWPLAHERRLVPDPWLHSVARMVIAGLVGFGISAQFVSLEGLELPYYSTLIGVVGLKLLTRWETTGQWEGEVDVEAWNAEELPAEEYETVV
jgi:probable O-glycosylation ligase (exosortase A-associated)